MNIDAKSSYTQAKNALSYEYYTGPNEVILLDHLEWESSTAKLNRINKNLSTPLYEEFLSAFKICNAELLDSWLIEYIDNLKQNDLPVDFTKTLTIQWMVEASLILVEFHSQLKRDELLTTQQITTVLSVRTLTELENEFRLFLMSLLDMTAELRKGRTNTQVQKAKQYIKEHFNENITLDSISKEVFLSPVYLSFLFKQVEHINLTDFLIQTRLEKAKELLHQSDFKTYVIAERVGYQDEKYFSRLFKKKIGMTPTEYRNTLRN